MTAKGCGSQWKNGTFVKAKVIRTAPKNQPYGESAPGWKLFPTRLPDQLDLEVNVGRAVALGTGPLKPEDPVRAEQEQNPELPKWQALLTGADQVVVPANSEGGV